MTEKAKLESELNILEAISQVQSGYPNFLAHKCSESGAILTEEFLNFLQEVNYPLEFIEESTITKIAFKEALIFFGDYYQIRNDERYSYYQIADIDEKIVIVNNGGAFIPNRQFLCWLDKNRPEYKNNVPKRFVSSNDVDIEDREIVLIDFESKNGLIYWISWFEDYFTEFARMNDFQIEKATKPQFATE